MLGYKQPCRYCERLIPPESKICPLCGKVNPLGPLRCPRCRNPVRKDYVVCNNCGLSLKVNCPTCGEITFFEDYCEHCGARLVVVCPRCGKEQPPIGDKCNKCGRPLKVKR
jgi:predicted amidophosphoribosyltransferase